MKNGLPLLPWLAAALPWCFIAFVGVPLGHDLPLELMRVAEYQRALGNSQYPPYWAPDLYLGFGSPIFLFYGHLCLLLSSAFGLLTGSLGIGLMLALATASVPALIALQRTAAIWSGSSQPSAAGRIASFLFIANPYLLGDAFLRNASAEYVALCGMPIGLYGSALIPGEPRRGAVWLALGTGWVLAAHNLSALSWISIALVLSIVELDRATLLHRLSGLALGGALAAFAWLPALRWKPSIQTQGLLIGKFDFHNQFQPWSHMFGDYFASVGPLPLLAAVAAIVSLALAPARRERRLIVALLAIAGGFLVLQLRGSIPLWERSAVLPYFQFPFRFMGPFACVTALLGGLAFARVSATLRPRTQALLEALLFVSCLVPASLQLGHVRSLARAERQALERRLQPSALRNSVQSSTVGDEYLPLHASANNLRERGSSPPIESATAGARIAIRRDEPRHIALAIKAERPTQLCLTRWSFPFWQVAVDRRSQVAAACSDGSIGVTVPSGRHDIEVDLDVPLERRLGLAISALALLGLGVCWRRRENSRPKPVQPATNR